MRATRWGAGALIVISTAGVVGWPVYVRPQIDALRHADAVFVLGGYDYGRYPYGMSLAGAGWAPTLVISNPNGPKDPWLHKYCATQHPEFRLVCFMPEPNRTRGEARELGRLAAENGWRTVIVVTARTQISRARYILQRCFEGELIMSEIPTPVPGPRLITEYFYQSAGYLRAFFEPGC